MLKVATAINDVRMQLWAEIIVVQSKILRKIYRFYMSVMKLALDLCKFEVSLSAVKIFSLFKFKESSVSPSTSKHAGNFPISPDSEKFPLNFIVNGRRSLTLTIVDTSNLLFGNFCVTNGEQTQKRANIHEKVLCHCRL